MILIWKGRPIEKNGECSMTEVYREYLTKTHCEKRVQIQMLALDMRIRWMWHCSILYTNRGMLWIG